jgi:peptidoglycan/LPS O-acetylase OafA/YrhL
MLEAVIEREAPRPRLDALTGLRWLAAFWVFGYHMLVFGPLPYPFNLPSRLGFMGVTFFFVLSGFVLTWSMRPSLKVSTFYVRRFARIWPAHMVALMLAIPVFYTLASEPTHSWVKPFSIPILLLSVALLQGFSRNPDILFSGNPAAWTLSCETLFYAVHPFLGKLLRRASQRGALIIAAMTLAIAFGYRSATFVGPAGWSGAIPIPFDRIPQFVLGMAIAWAIAQGWRPRIPVSVAWIAFVVTFSWLTVGPSAGYGALSELAANFSNELATAACALLIVAVSTNTLRGRRSWLAHPMMIRLGNWSYAFYLVHATVMYAVLNVIGGPRGSGGSNLIWGAGIFAVALALAAGIHHLVEVPSERAIRGWKDRRDQAASTQGKLPGEAQRQTSARR